MSDDISEVMGLRSRFSTFTTGMLDFDGRLNDDQIALRGEVTREMDSVERSASMVLFFGDGEQRSGVYVSPTPYTSQISQRRNRDDGLGFRVRSLRGDQAKDVSDVDTWERSIASIMQVHMASGKGVAYDSYVPLVHSCLRLCMATYNLRLMVPAMDAFSNNPAGLDRHGVPAKDDEDDDDEKNRQTETVDASSLLSSIWKWSSEGIGPDLALGLSANITSAAASASGSDFWDPFEQLRSRARDAAARAQAPAWATEPVTMTQVIKSVNLAAASARRLAASSEGADALDPEGVEATSLVEAALLSPPKNRTDDGSAPPPDILATPELLEGALRAAASAGLSEEVVEHIRAKLKAAATSREVTRRAGERTAVNMARDALGVTHDEEGKEEEGDGYGGNTDGASDGRGVVVEPLSTNKACALFVHDVESDVAIVAFRGTKEPLDVATDLAFTASELFPGVNHGVTGDDVVQVHAGFLSAHESVHSLVASRLETLSDDTVVIMTGHSLGGALASIAAAKLCFMREQKRLQRRRQGQNEHVDDKDDNKNSNNCILVTAGAPAVGNAAFVDWLTPRVAPHGGLRLYNDGDIVPLLSAPMGYRHAGVPLKRKVTSDAVELFKSTTIDPNVGGSLPFVAPHVLYTLAGILHVFPVLGVEVRRRREDEVLKEPT